MPDFICPVCRQKLNRAESAYRCESGHSFDIAKQGYVNLFMNSASGKRHGDDKLMVKARRDFLDKGYYDALSEKIAEKVCSFADDSVSVIDVGCGECKYTADIISALKASDKCFDVSGIDISKQALIYGAKRTKEASLAVASAYSLPFGDECADIVVNVFAPICAGEFSRVLKRGGKLICAVPLEKHLWELKELIYDEPYENPTSDFSIDGFSVVSTDTVKYKISLACSEDIQNLFKMTPYYYKTGREDQAKAEKADHLEVSLEFGVIVYEKN